MARYKRGFFLAGLCLFATELPAQSVSGATYLDMGPEARQFALRLVADSLLSGMVSQATTSAESAEEAQVRLRENPVYDCLTRINESELAGAVSDYLAQLDDNSLVFSISELTAYALGEFCDTSVTPGVADGDKPRSAFPSDG